MRKFRCVGITKRTDLIYELGLQDYFDKIEVLSKKEKMILMCNKVIEFMNNNKRPFGKGTNKEERMLSTWLSKARMVYKITYPCIVDIAKNAGYPTLFDPINLEQKAIDICNELFQFIKSNNRTPSKESTNKYERKLGCWLTKMRQAKEHRASNNKIATFYPILDEMAYKEGYSKLFNITNYEHNAIYKFNEVSQFIKLNSTIPTTTTKNETERNLGLWISEMRTAKANGGKTTGGTKFYKCLDDMATSIGYPNLFDSKDLEQNAINKFYEVIAFIKLNDRFPNKESKNKIEVQLGNWIGTIKNAKQGKSQRGKFYPVLLQLAIDHGYPNMFDLINREQIAIDKFNEIIEFIKTTNIIPTPESTNKYEKQLGAWLHARRMAKKDLGHGTLFYKILDDMAIKSGLENIFNENWKDTIK